jgi:thiazolylpeptide-type bacteriocin precursor
MIIENHALEKDFQNENLLDHLERELHLLEVETFEIEAVVDLGQVIPVSVVCTSSSTSCSSACTLTA